MMKRFFSVGPTESDTSEFAALVPDKALAAKICKMLNDDPDRGCEYAYAPVEVAFESFEDVIE